MNPKPSLSDRYAGQVIVGIYLFFVILFSLLYIAAAHSKESEHNRLPRTEKTLRLQLFLGNQGQGLSVELHFI